VTPAHDWRHRQRTPDVWLLCERDLGPTARTNYYLVDLPATASVKALVYLAHQRWAIEQQYQELKDKLGLDHLRGALAARLATPRRPEGAGLQLPARRTPTAAPAESDTATSPRRDVGHPDRASVHHPAALSEVDA
jgi:hypothetical protein